MKIEELKDGDVVVQCIDIGRKSSYTPSVRRKAFTVVVDSYGVVLDDGEGCQYSPDFSKGRWYLQKKRDWTPNEMKWLVGKVIMDESGTHLITGYRNADGILEAGSKRIGPGDAGSFFGEKYDLVKID